MKSEPPSRARLEPGELQRLVDAARGGDREALARLFEVHEAMMLRWARRRLGQSLRTLEETRDILHEAYSVVLRKIAAFRPEDSRSFARWLRGIITKVVLQRSGQSWLLRRRFLEEAQGEAPRDPDLTPASRLGLTELVEERARILRRMDRTDRLIWRLRRRGCAAVAIADRLGLSDRAVRMRHARVEARLRVRLARYLEGGDAPGGEGGHERR